MTQYQVPITLTILGPFLTAATGPQVYGMDKAFHRDGNNRPIIPDRHVKGKLRMALEELSELTGADLVMDISAWFGTKSEDGDYGEYDPAPGTMNFTHFKLTDEIAAQKKARTRTAIHAASGTAAEKQLRSVEDLFASGTETKWKGSVIFYTADPATAEQTKNILLLGFSWLTNMGAEKGVGFGRLKKVQVGEPEPVLANEFDVAALGSQTHFHLRIRPLEKIMIGGVKKPGSNLVRSERVISGGAIKGALAAGLNLVHGRPAHLPLTSEAAQEMPGFEQLVAHYQDIRITHAFPALANGPRPVKLPLSTVKGGKSDYVDLALISNQDILIDDQAPVYYIDWKSPKEFKGAAAPREIFVTRTEIEDASRRSQEENLFTYSYLLPEDDQGGLVEWICNVNFDAVDSGVRSQVRNQFGRAVAQFLTRLGKLNHAVKVVILPGTAQPKVGTYQNPTDEIIITLQSDAIMLNPEKVRSLGIGEDLSALYAGFWDEISKSSLTLIDFYAHQNFQGGYLYHRYLGAGEREQNPNQYYPYYLTGAGSVFRLKLVDEKTANDHMDRWKQRGLDLPEWAHQKYGRFGRTRWQNCPFVPENGYGEIAVNLSWHWEKQPSKDRYEVNDGE